MDAARKRSESAQKQLEAECTTLDGLLKATPVDKEAVNQQLLVVDGELTRFEGQQAKYIDLLLAADDDALFQAEEAKSILLRKRRVALGVTVDKLSSPVPTTGATGGGPSASASGMPYHVNLPKRELPKFSGDVRLWKSFWASFEEVDKDAAIPEIEKYNYLLQQMVPGSAADKVVSSFPAAATSYQLAKKELEERFGRETTLIKVCVRDLLQLMDSAKNKKQSFVDVATSLQSQILYLEQLGVTKDKYGLLLYPIIESSIPVEVLNRYLETTGCKEDLNDILGFLKKEVRRREESARAQAAFKTTQKDESKPQKSSLEDNVVVPTATNFLHMNTLKCGFCGNNHHTQECRKANAMSMDQRKSALRKSKTCFKCLGNNHISVKCKSKITCVSCGGNHHMLMCGGAVQPAKRLDQINLLQQQQSPQSQLESQPPVNWNYGPGPSVPSFMLQQQQPRPSSHLPKRMDLCNYVRRPEVLLETLLVHIYAPSGDWKVVRAMIDGGSQSSYIRRGLAEELQLITIGKEKVVHQTFGAKLSKEMEHPVTRIAVSGLLEPYLHQYTFLASVVNDIAKKVIAVPQGPWIKECTDKAIPLTDIGNECDIDIMIGSDVSPYLKVGMESVLLPSNIVATETRVGWYLGGKLAGTEKRDPTKAMMCISMMTLDREIESYWALETIGIKDAAENRSRKELEEASLLHFQQTVRRDETGRYEVHLPHIEGHPSIPDNRNQAYRRLEKTTNDLLKDGYLDAYAKIFHEWEQEGIIEKVDTTVPVSGVVHYLGHRAVFKEGSTTPVRPVYNASGKTGLNPSLNDCLEKGPNLLDLIPTILSRFRMNRIGVVADVRKAFLQLKVTPEHRDCLRFLWWDDATTRKKVVEYRHCRVVFGVSASPFLLGAVIQHLLADNENKFTNTVRVLRSAFYVDNCVASLPTLQEVINFKKESQEIFSSAQMDLRGWEYGPSSEGKDVPVLGLKWNTRTDELSYDVKKMEKTEKEVVTKRRVLKLANSLYDPLGLISPVIIVIKMLFKRICFDERNFSWDAELPEEYAAEFRSWTCQLEAVWKIQIPRLVPDGKVPKTSWSLHVMCDASKDAYACCIYLRVDSIPIRIQLVQARARVTPKKVLTIPRAELLGCLIAARLYNQVKEDLDLNGVPVTFWCDSTTALSWIRRTDTVWGVFVNRRVEEIRKLTTIEDWKHVPGDINPADLPSRGTTAEKYGKLRWWEGPSWLYEDPSSFPSSVPEVDEEAISQEKRKTVVSAVVTNKEFVFQSLECLGKWTRIIRAVAYIKRFIRNTRLPQRKTTGPLSQDEISAAETTLLMAIQQCFSLDELSGYKLVKCDDGLLRVVTKIVERDDDYNFRYPVLLSPKSEVVRLLVMHEHVKNAHCGTDSLRTILRSKFWIVKSRQVVKSVVRECAVCRIHAARRCQVEQAPLPLERLQTTRCFEVCGVDLAGPLLLKDGSKAWIVLFTCAVYRAVHLELVTSLSTDAFIVALRKFVARRGRPRVCWSDNGTNFRGCHNLFQSLDWNQVEKYATVSAIKWNFNPPTAAWWGGFWERLIGMMKQLLRRVLGNKSVYFSELEVLVMEVEAVLNERPLTYVTEDPGDLVPLTPSMFMRDLTLPYLPEADVCGQRLRGNLRHVQSLREQLRSRMVKEYLAELVHYGKLKKTDILQVGDVVLVEVEGKKRLEWPMGIILEVYPGKDGISRCAKIRIKSGEITRPFQRLFPLELRRDEKESMPLENVVKAEKAPREDDEEDKLFVITRSGRKVRKPDRF